MTTTHPLDAFVLDNAEQIDLTFAEADRLADLGLIYRAEETNPHYFTTHHDVSLGAVDRALQAIRQTNPADVTVWRITRQDILDRCSGERVLPITDEQYERIAKAIDHSSVSECIEGAIGQVVPYIDDEEPS